MPTRLHFLIIKNAMKSDSMVKSVLLKNITFNFPDNIRHLQRVILSWFILDGGIQEFRGILSADMFWEYGRSFSVLMENSSTSYEFLSLFLGSQRNIDAYIILLDSYTSEWIQKKEKYIKELFLFFIRSNFERWSDGIIPNLDKVKTILNRIEEIQTGRQTQEYNIDNILYSVQDKIERNKKGMIWYSTGVNTIDKYTDGLRKWSIMRLNAYANTGKSKLSYFVCNNILRKYPWTKILYFSLEVQKDEVAMNLLSNWYQIGYKDLAKWREETDMSCYADNKIYIIDDMFDLQQIVDFVEIRQPDVVFIDYIQNIKIKWTVEYERMSTVATELQQMAIKNNVAVFDLSQVSNEWAMMKNSPIIHSKGSWSLVSACDVGLMLARNKDRLRLDIPKNKFWPCVYEIDLIPNFSIGHFEDLWPMGHTNY